VGPRPLLTEYLLRYTELEMQRHSVRPGITGWAQINGIRDTLSPNQDEKRFGEQGLGEQRLDEQGLDEKTLWDLRIAYDLWYVQHRSWRVDARILATTVRHTAARLVGR
jgi:sugar transferase EpsL